MIPRIDFDKAFNKYKFEGIKAGEITLDLSIPRRYPVKSFIPTWMYEHQRRK